MLHFRERGCRSRALHASENMRPRENRRVGSLSDFDTLCPRILMYVFLCLTEQLTLSNEMHSASFAIISL